MEKQIQERIFSPDGVVGFSYLPPDIQIEVLKKSKDDSHKNTIRALNPALFDNLELLLTAEESPREDILDDLFSFESYASSVSKIIRSFENMDDLGGPKNIEKEIEASVLEQFADIQYVRLLYQ